MLAQHCRLCVCVPPETARNMFVKQDDEVAPLVDQIENVLKIEYDRNPLFPQKICDECLRLVNMCVPFVHNINIAEATIRRLCESCRITGEEEVEVELPGLNGAPGVFKVEPYMEIIEVDPYAEYSSEDEDAYRAAKAAKQRATDCTSTPVPVSAAGSSFQQDNAVPVGAAGSSFQQDNAVPVSAAGSSFQQDNDVPEGAAGSSFQQDNAVPVGAAGSSLQQDNAVPNIYPSTSGANQMSGQVEPARSQSPVSASPISYLCPICDEYFVTKVDFIIHQSKHNAAAPYACVLCPYDCADHGALITHIKAMHDAKQPFICTQCYKRFARRSDLRKHTFAHTGVRPFQCDFCPKSYSRKANLTKHVQAYHSENVHSCQHCRRTFMSELALSQHVTSHTTPKPFPCFPCGIGFSTKYQLQQHWRTQHVGMAMTSENNDLPTTSAECPSTLASGRPWRKCREHKCGTCGTSFIRAIDLQHHQALHLETKYSCTQCDSYFLRYEKLLQHERLDHAGEFKCSACSYVSITKRGLDEHMKEHAADQDAADQHAADQDAADQQSPAPLAMGFYTEAST